MLFPVRQEDLKKCRFSSPYGARIHPITKLLDGHRAIDIAMPVGTPLLAIDDGTIIKNNVNIGGYAKGYGYYLVIKHDNGLYSLFAHLKELSKCKVGSRVRKGQVVAYSGNTGSSTGPHVHFEIHKGNFLFRTQVTGKDTAIDPVTYYPQLKGMLGKYLNNLVFDANEDEKDEEDDIVEFEEKWQENLLVDTIEKFRDKKVLNNADYWLDKVKNKTLTTSELGLLALVMAERD